MESFTYQICYGSISSATVTVTVTSVKVQSPVDDSLNVVEEIATDLDVAGNGILIDGGDTITILKLFLQVMIQLYQFATGGSITSFILTYTSDIIDYVGTDLFEYTLTTVK